MDDGRRALRRKERWCWCRWSRCRVGTSPTPTMDGCRVGTSPTPTMDDGRVGTSPTPTMDGCRVGTSPTPTMDGCRVGTSPTPTMDDGRQALRRKYQACVRFICRHFPCYSVLGSV